MTLNVLHSAKRFAAAAAVMVFPRSPRFISDMEPEPRERFVDAFDRATEADAWMFEADNEAVSHRAEMLGTEFDRLSQMLSGVREALSAVAAEAPVNACETVSTFDTPFLDDALLFEAGSPVWMSGDVYVSDDDFLFDDEVRQPSPAITQSGEFFEYAAAA